MRNGILVVFGRKGAGKSNLTRAFLARQQRTLTIDAFREYGGVVISDIHSLAAYVNARGEGPFHVAFRDRGLDRTNIGKKLRMLQSLRNAWICFEEASKWVGPATSEPEALWFVQYGRHNALSSIWVARRPAEISRHMTAQADVIVSFEQQEPRDLDYIASIGGHEAAERIAKLGPHEWDFVLREHDEIVADLEAISDESGGGGEALAPAIAATQDPAAEAPAPPSPEPEPRKRGRPRKAKAVDTKA